MATLWFQNSLGQEKIIARQCDTWAEIHDAICNYIDKCNENKPSDKRFKMYYTRTWSEGGRTKIDVGSWSEFFYTDMPIEGANLHE